MRTFFGFVGPAAQADAPGRRDPSSNRKDRNKKGAETNFLLSAVFLTETEGGTLFPGELTDKAVANTKPRLHWSRVSFIDYGSKNKTRRVKLQGFSYF